MQLGINLLCASGMIGEEQLPLLDLAANSGYDGVEIPVLEGSPDHYQWLASELDKRKLRRTCTAISPTPEIDPTSDDLANRKRGIEHLNWILECAEALGAESIGGPFHAPIGHFTGAGPTKAEWKRGAEAHAEMAEKASLKGIKLALEPLNRFETHFLNTADQACAYCEFVGHTNFGIMYDTFHSHIEEKDQPSAIAKLGSHIAELHVSENDRGIVGTGQVDFPAIFKQIKNIQFDGWIVVEAFGSGVPELAAATRIWRPMFPDFETLFRQSHDYVRREWEAA